MFKHKSIQEANHPITGYSQVWYTSPPSLKADPEDAPYVKGLCEDGIPVEGKDDLTIQTFYLWSHGLQFGFKDGKRTEYVYLPFLVGRYTTEAFLLSPSIVIINELEEKHGTLPKQVITVLSNTLEDMIKTANVLKLPTEKLKELEKAANCIEVD